MKRELLRRLRKIEAARAAALNTYFAEFSYVDTHQRGWLWVRILPNGQRYTVECPDECADDEQWEREIAEHAECCITHEEHAENERKGNMLR